MTAKELPAGDWRRAVYGRGQISGVDRRRAPAIAERARIIAEQGNRCLYCEIPIGTIVDRRGRDVVLRLNWDHFVPYAYVARNPRDNWVLACHVCNGLKRGRIFKTIQEVRDVVLPERLRKGYEEPLAVLRRIGKEPTENLWPDRLRLANGDIVHYAGQSREGFWATACGLERAAAAWRTPGGSTRACAQCVIQSGIAVPHPRIPARREGEAS